MNSTLFRFKDYQKVAYFDSVVDFFAFLKNHPGYKNIFNQYDEHELHRGDAERIFIQSLYQDYARLYRFANKEQRRNLELLFFRYEVNILKACIRLIYNTEDAYDLSIFHSFFSKHSNINVAALAASHSMGEYIQNLKGTKYYPLFYKIQQKQNVTSFDYEMQLDIFYFKKTWKLIDKVLTGSNKASLKHILGTEIDLLNIMWIYRAKKIYDMSSSDIYSVIIPINYKLLKEQLLQLSETATIDEFMITLSNTYYKTIHQFLSDGTIEHTYKTLVTKAYKKNNSKHPESMAPVNYYLYQKEMEINRITTALECIRYGLEPQQKLKYIMQ